MYLDRLHLTVMYRDFQICRLQYITAPRLVTQTRSILTPKQQPRMPTRTQHMFSAPIPNYNPRSNVFKQSPRPFNNFPKPMSGVSHFAPRALPHSTHDWSKHGNPQPSSYFKTRDVNVNECASHYNNYCDYPEFYEPTCDTESYYNACDSYNEYECSYVNNYESDSLP